MSVQLGLRLCAVWFALASFSALGLAQTKVVVINLQKIIGETECGQRLAYVVPQPVGTDATDHYARVAEQIGDVRKVCRRTTKLSSRGQQVPQ